MNYIDAGAAAIESHVDPRLIPTGDSRDLFRGYSALMYSTRGDVSARDVHNVWAAWAASKSPESAAIRPYEELDDATRNEDEPYVEAIRRAWTELQP
jgi:hypothetical protein